MTFLCIGLLLFLGVHLVRALAPGVRAAAVARIGEGAWKGLYALVSVAGLVLVVIGYGEAREAPTLVYAPPAWARHIAHVLTLVAFILLFAPYFGRNHFRARFGHPMVLGVKAWALAHLLANGALHDVLLFGSFLAWGVVAFVLLRRRDRALGTVPIEPSWSATALTVAAGTIAWFVFARWLHPMWIGVPVFPGG